MSDIVKKSIQLRTGLFSSRTLEYVIRVSKRSRKSRIKVDVDGIEVILPEHVHSDHAERMMRENSEWILKKVALFDEIKKQQQARLIEERTLLYHGKKVTIVKDLKITSAKARKIRIEANRVYLPVNGNSKSQASLALQKYLKEVARREITAMAEALSQKLGTDYARITIRDQRTRWGACSARKSLSFNWRLVMAPPEVAEYVVIHELAHLIEMNHSARFWKLVEKHCPDYKKKRLWLKKNGHLLRPDFISLV